MKSRIERLLENALREQTISINHTAPMQAVNRPSRVREFVRKVKTALGTRYERVKAHVRQNKGKYALAGVVGLAGATMLHKAAKIESPRYARFVNKHTKAFMKGATSRAEAVKMRLAPHLKSYARDIKWFGKKLRPVGKTVAKYPRASMLLGALAAERAHKFAYRNSERYRRAADSVGKKIKDYADDSYIIQSAKSEFDDRFGRRLGASIAKNVSAQVDDALFDAANYGYRVARGITNPITGVTEAPDDDGAIEVDDEEEFERLTQPKSRKKRKKKK